MAFDVLKAEIGILLTRMQNEPRDRHEIQLVLKAKLDELKALGLPVPEDLARLEQFLEAEFAAETARLKKVRPYE